MQTIGFLLTLLGLCNIQSLKIYYNQKRAAVPPWEEPDKLFMYFVCILIVRFIIIPFLIGVGLFLSCSLWLILVLSLVWVLSFVPLLPFYLISLYPLLTVCGWVYGGLVYSRFFSISGEWYYISSGVGVLCMFLVYIISNVIITMPNHRANY